MDWIEARFECSAEHAWLVLRERLKGDVADWQKRAGVDERVQLTEDADRVIISRVKEYGNGAWAAVEKQGKRFAVRSGAHARSAEHEVKKSTLAASLNAAGECRLLHEGKELEFWQAARLILEPILFGD